MRDGTIDMDILVDAMWVILLLSFKFLGVHYVRLCAL